MTMTRGLPQKKGEQRETKSADFYSCSIAYRDMRVRVHALWLLCVPTRGRLKKGKKIRNEDAHTHTVAVVVVVTVGRLSATHGTHFSRLPVVFIS